MKTRFLFKACLLVVLLTGCGKDGAGIAGLFIPNFTNLWTSSRSTNFFFNPTENDVSEGIFTGTEEENGEFNNFEGSFNNYNIEFTFSNGPEAGVKYSGQFVKDSNPLTMNVKGTNNVRLTIVKN